MRISDWSSDVCSSDLAVLPRVLGDPGPLRRPGKVVDRGARALVARHDIYGQTRLVLAEAGPRADEIGALDPAVGDVAGVRGLPRRVRAIRALQGDLSDACIRTGAHEGRQCPTRILPQKIGRAHV